MATCPSGHESVSDDFCDVCGIRIGAPTLSSVDAGPGVSAPPGPAGLGVTIADSGGLSGSGETCPRCGAARTGQFCEDCGHNFTDGASAQYPAPAPARYEPAAPAHYEPPAPTRYEPAVQRPSSAAAPPAPVPPPPAPAQSAPVPSPSAQPGGTWSAVVTADRAYFESVRAASGPEAAGIGFPSYCPERRFRLAGGEVRIGRRSASRGIEPEIDLTGPPADPGVSRLHAVLIAAPDGTWSVLDPGSANGTLVNGSEIPAGEAVPLRDGDRINLGAWTLLMISRENLSERDGTSREEVTWPRTPRGGAAGCSPRLRLAPAWPDIFSRARSARAAWPPSTGRTTSRSTALSRSSSSMPGKASTR